MYSTLLSVALFSALAIQGALAADGFNVDTPTINACSDAKLTWADTGAASYNVAIVPVDDPCNEVLVDLGDHTINHITWKNVTLKPNTVVMVSVLDSNDEEGWSGHVTVGSGSDTSCLGVSSSSAAASGTESSTSKTSLIVNAQSATSTHSIAAAPTTTDGATAVGAAAGGALSGAGSLQISASAFALTALAAVAALAF